MEDERVEDEEAEKEEEGVLILGPVSWALARLLIERSIGEQLE